MAEQLAVNQKAVGSSPTSGAIREAAEARLLAKWGNDAWFVPKGIWDRMVKEEMQND